MHTFDVYFNNMYYGHTWADHEFEAIAKLAGEHCIDELGQRDYRWTAILRY